MPRSAKSNESTTEYTAVVTATPAARETTANTVNIGAATRRRIACLNNTAAAYD